MFKPLTLGQKAAMLACSMSWMKARAARKPSFHILVEYFPLTSALGTQIFKITASYPQQSQFLDYDGLPSDACVCCCVVHVSMHASSHSRPPSATSASLPMARRCSRASLLSMSLHQHVQVCKLLCYSRRCMRVTSLGCDYLWQR